MTFERTMKIEADQIADKIELDKVYNQKHKGKERNCAIRGFFLL